MTWQFRILVVPGIREGLAFQLSHMVDKSTKSLPTGCILTFYTLRALFPRLHEGDSRR